MSFIKYFIGGIILLLIEKILISKGVSCNFSFLFIFVFTINYFFPQKQHKRINSSEIIPVGVFLFFGFIEDLFQGIIGPFIISKTITGTCLMILVHQLFFNWNEFLKSLVILSFTILDNLIYTFVVSFFSNINFNYILTVKSFLAEALLNIPIGLILTKGKP